MGAKEPPSGIVTALFSDIEGSTALVQELGDDAVPLFERHRALLRAAFDHHGGFEQATEGDSFFVVFERPADAVAAAVAAQRALCAEQWGDSPIRVRIGIHTGEATWRGGDYWGIGIHEAARVGAVGHGGQTIISATTADAVRAALPDGATLRDLGLFRLKDLTEPQRLFQVDHAELSGDFPPLRTLDFHKHNLPTQRTPLFGRDALLGDLEARLAKERILTLTGVGGTGKTRLALQLAANHIHDYRDGAFLVDLAVVSDPALVAVTTAQTVRMPAQIGADADDLAALVAFLASREMLIILDNCEHLLDAASEVADAIIDRAPGIRIVVTSREPLGIDGEAIVRVPSLDTSNAVGESDAARLFRDRAARAGARLEQGVVADEFIATIVRRLDGVPLAIELAAARAAELPLATVAQLLDDRFRLLTGGARKAQQRQQTMLAAVEWSHTLLSDAEKRLFRRLSTFPGGFTADAAVAVCAPDDPIGAVDVLSSLVKKSLVSFDGARYRLLETLRLFAQARLAEEAEADECRRRHAEWVTQTPVNIAISDIDTMFSMLDDVRAALDWCESTGDVERGVRVVSAAAGVWFACVITDEVLPWFDRARAIDESLDVEARLAWRLAEYWVTINTLDIGRMMAIAIEVDALDPEMRTAAGVAGGWTRALFPGLFDPDAGIAQLEALEHAQGWREFTRHFVGGISESVLVAKAALHQIAGRYEAAIDIYESAMRVDIERPVDYIRTDRVVALALAGRASEAVAAALEVRSAVHPREPHFTGPTAHAAMSIALAASGDIASAAQSTVALFDRLARDYAHSDTARGFAYAATVSLCRFGDLPHDGHRILAGVNYYGYGGRWLGALGLLFSSERSFGEALDDDARGVVAAEGRSMTRDDLLAYARSVAERLANA